MHKLVSSLNKIIKSNQNLDQAYSEWINSCDQEELSTLSLKEWQEIGEKLNKDDTWGQERFDAWSDEDGDDEDGDDEDGDDEDGDDEDGDNEDGDDE